MICQFIPFYWSRHACKKYSIKKYTCEYANTSTHCMLHNLLLYMFVYTVRLLLLLLCFADAAAVDHCNYWQLLISPYIFVMHYSDYDNLYYRYFALLNDAYNHNN